MGTIDSDPGLAKDHARPLDPNGHGDDRHHRGDEEQGDTSEQHVDDTLDPL